MRDDILPALLDQLDALERSARELRAPLLAGQAEALRQGVLELAASSEGLEAAAVKAQARVRRLVKGIEENRRRHENSQRSFDRLRRGFALIESLRDLADLPELLEKLRALFKVGLIRLVLDDTLAPHLPPGFPTLPQEKLAALAGRIRSGGRVSCLGPASDAPDGLLARPEANRWGSVFAHALRDRFKDGGWAGVILMADKDPARYRPDMAADYLEHFSEALAGAVAEVADRRRAEELREDVERITRHDLKSPLSAILTLPHLLLDEDNLTDQQREMLQLVLESGRRMQSLITLSLSLYRMERGVYELAPEELDLAGLARSVWEESGGPYRASGLELTVRTSEEPFPAFGEELLCYTMLANLVKNALEASEPGETVEVRLSREPGWVVVEVANTRDVPGEIRKSFFDKYATSGKHGGTGLGTYTARLIARVHGGDAEMETGQGKGTVVRVRLPDRDICSDGG